MEKDAVISFRDSLTNNGNYNAIKIAFDNGVQLIASSDAIIWDDSNERVIGFISDGESESFSAEMPIRIICSTYENIQFITANIKVEDLDGMIDRLKQSMTTISDDSKKKIINHFSKIHDYRTELKDTFYYHTSK